MRRIGIIGCAGTGKSSLARALAAELGLPLLEAKSITEDILRRDGYDYSSCIQVERFLANTGRQNEILRRTLEQQSVDEFVADRTVVDLAAYMMCEMHSQEDEALRDVLKTCREKVSTYTHLLFCPWEDRPVAGNQKRTLNPYYQYLIHLTERGIICDWECSYHLMLADTPENRLEEALKAVEP